MNTVLKVCVCFMLCLPIVPLPNTNVIAKTATATINVSVLNVREGPGLSYDIVDKVKLGEHYQIVEQKNDWVKIQLTNGRSGWIASWFMTKQQNVAEQQLTVLATVDNLRIRTGPGTSFQIIGQIDKNNTALFLEENENWTKINYQNTIGWVSSKYVQRTDANSVQTQMDDLNKLGIVAVQYLNVREIPSLTGQILEHLQKGEKVTIIEEQENWAKVQYDHGQGWVYKKYLHTNNTKENEQDTKKMMSGVITATVLNVRNSSTLNGDVIGHVKKGEKVDIIKVENNWCNILLPDKTRGWIASWFVEFTKEAEPEHMKESDTTAEYVKILYNGTNIRTGPSTSDQVIMRANEGESFQILAVTKEWYKLSLPNNQIGYVASWIVESSDGKSNLNHFGIEKYLKGKTIVLDPGHGGRDSGTIGISGAFEKDITLSTARLVYGKLQAAGANVLLTRNNDYYISLRDRVNISSYYHADAFVSIHCDSINQQNIRGTATYYYYSRYKGLAQDIQTLLIQNTGFPDRHIRFGDYHVIRENSQPSILIELGFLSNIEDELSVISGSYQEKAANAIYYGLAQYFKN